MIFCDRILLIILDYIVLIFFLFGLYVDRYGIVFILSFVCRE